MANRNVQINKKQREKFIYTQLPSNNITHLVD